MARDPYGGNFKLARAQAFDRSGGTCQLCGTAQATDAHHWAFDDYPSGEDVTADDLVALCKMCHEVATTLRRTLRAGGNRFEIVHNITRSIAMQYRFRISGASALSCTTGQPGLTPAALSAVRSQRSRQRAAATEQRATMSDSVNSSAGVRFGSTAAERLRSRQQLLERRSKPGPGEGSRGRRSGAG